MSDEEAAPAPIEPDLDWLDILDRPGGHPISARRRKKMLDKAAADLMRRGESFTYNGVRHVPAS